MDTLNYILFKNPVSSAVIQGTKSSLEYAGITPKASSGAVKSTKKIMINNVGIKPFELLGSNRAYIRFAGVSGALATVLGAIGAHRQYSPENAAEMKRLFETANRFHFFSTLGMIAVPFVRFPHLSGALLITGTVLFCGPMYYRAFKNNECTKLMAKVNKVVPVGGFMMITAWLTMVL